MLLDKKRVSLVTKIFAVVITLAFIGSMAVSVVPNLGGSGGSAANSSMTFSDYVKAGNDYSDNKKYKEAAQMYEKALGLDPKNADVRTDMAIAYAGGGDIQKAIKECIQVTVANPKHPNAHFNLGVFYRALGKKSEASYEFNTFLKLQPSGDAATQAKQYLADLAKKK